MPKTNPITKLQQVLAIMDRGQNYRLVKNGEVLTTGWWWQLRDYLDCCSPADFAPPVRIQVHAVGRRPSSR